MRRSFVLVTFSVLALAVFGEGFSLRQCVEYAGERNGNVVGAGYDVKIASSKVKEQVGSLVPQLDASGSYVDNLKLTTTLIPGEFFGEPGTMMPVTFGTKHNMSGSLQLTQKLFDPSLGIALKAARISRNYARESLNLTKEQVSYNVGVMYYQTLILAKQGNTLSSALKTSEKLLASTELRYKNGLAKKVDVDKIRVGYNNLLSQLQQSELNYSQSLNNLKYGMGMPLETPISLTDTLPETDGQVLDAGSLLVDPRNRSDYRLQEITLDAYKADRSRNVSGYLPTLSLVVNAGTNAMRNDFNFLNTNLEDKWYKNSSLVFSLRMPIFDGLQRHQRILQSDLNIQKTEVKMQQVKESISLDVANYENQYQTALTNIQNEKANVDLAESVYKNTRLQYEQGISSSLELVQAESSYTESINNYYTKLLGLYIARFGLEQAKGNLLNYINNQ